MNLTAFRESFQKKSPLIDMLWSGGHLAQERETLGKKKRR